MATCKTCPFWDDSQDAGEETAIPEIVRQGDAGYCFRYAPRGRGVAEWPVTWSEDWCGEHPERSLHGLVRYEPDGCLRWIRPASAQHRPSHVTPGPDPEDD